MSYTLQKSAMNDSATMHGLLEWLSETACFMAGSPDRKVLSQRPWTEQAACRAKAHVFLDKHSEITKDEVSSPKLMNDINKCMLYTYNHVNKT